jgi:hypothetical protein
MYIVPKKASYAWIMHKYIMDDDDDELSSWNIYK